MMKLSKNQTNLAVGATILGVGYYLMSRPASAESPISNPAGDAIRMNAYQRKAKEFDLVQGLGHAIPHKHGLHVHAGKHRRGVRNSKKLVDREGSEEMRSLPLPVRRGKQFSRGSSPVSAKKGMPVRRRRMRRPRKAIRVRDRSTTNPNYVRKPRKKYSRPTVKLEPLPLRESHVKFQEMVLPPIQGLGMTTSTSTSTSSSHVPEMMRRQNEEQWNHKEAQMGDLFGAAPPSIRNRVSHRLSGSESYHAKIEPNFSANHSTVQKVDAIRNIDLLGYSGMEVGQSNGDWIL